MRNKLLTGLFCSVLLPGLPQIVCPQSIADRLQTTVKKMEADPQMKHAILSLYVEDVKTGAVVFDRNSQVGLAPASCQKLFTSVAALDILGPDYRYVTSLGYSGRPDKGSLKGNIYIVGSGDPTLGSWRYDSTRDTLVLARWTKALSRAGIKSFEGDIIADDSRWGTQPLPGGWIWEDIGNYYGAGTWGLNWHENQFDLRMKPGRAEGDSVRLILPAEELEIFNWANELTTGAPGSGDNAFIYLPPYSFNAFVRGTVPLQKEDFVIAGSIPVPPKYAAVLLGERLQQAGLVKRAGDAKIMLELSLEKKTIGHPDAIIDKYYSPRLDSINYWFLRKSINLYGEALIKTMAFEKTGKGSTEKGAAIVRDFWGQRGIDPGAIHIQDGSGLSPQNRVTTDALVKVLQYARSRPWYASFYKALPEINGMKMKSGAIGGARSYAGYQLSRDGHEYVFSMIVNNFDGAPSAVVKKMFEVLDQLK